MSRVGKKPGSIPAGVTIDLKGQHLKAKGKRGELQLWCMTTSRSPGKAMRSFSKPRTESRRARMQWGTARNLASNVVRGVSDGFTVNLEINGVGYRAQADAKNLKLQLGFSHDVEVPIPTGIQIKAIKPTEIEITGADRQKSAACGRDPQPAPARALQGQGHQVLDREDPAQGKARRSRGECWRRAKKAFCFVIIRLYFFLPSLRRIFSVST